MKKIKTLICPRCKLVKLYIHKTDKKGNIIEAKCIICKTIFKIVDTNLTGLYGKLGYYIVTEIS